MRDLVEWVYGVVEEGSCLSMRLQTFPKSFAEWFMECWSQQDSTKSAQGSNKGGQDSNRDERCMPLGSGSQQATGASCLRFDPKDFDVVLSIVFASGCLFASLQTCDDASISQLISRHDHNAVCKAQVQRVGGEGDASASFVAFLFSVTNVLATWFRRSSSSERHSAERAGRCVGWTLLCSKERRPWKLRKTRKGGAQR